MLKLKTKIKNFAIDIDIHTTLGKVKKNKVCFKDKENTNNLPNILLNDNYVHY